MMDALEGMTKDTPEEFRERLRVIGCLSEKLEHRPEPTPNLREAYHVPWAVLAEDAAHRVGHYTEREREILEDGTRGVATRQSTDQEVNEIMLKYFDRTAKAREKILTRAFSKDIADTADLIGEAGPTFENQEFTDLVTIL